MNQLLDLLLLMSTGRVDNKNPIQPPVDMLRFFFFGGGHGQRIADSKKSHASSPLPHPDMGEANRRGVKCSSSGPSILGILRVCIMIHPAHQVKSKMCGKERRKTTFPTKNEQG
jgi:hypothetical protein